MLTNTIIKNINGKEYKVLSVKGSYTLLEKVKGGYQPFIIVYDIKEFKDGYSWGNGYYYSTLEDAMKIFNNK
jgi:hypothetical protein